MSHSSIPLFPLLLIGAACAGNDASEPGGSFAELSEITTASSVVLEDPAERPLGDAGFLLELDDGFVLADRLTRELRKYSRHGRLLARHTAFGEGPFEFRGIGGLGRLRDGRVVVMDPQNGRVTYFGPDLTPDTLFSPDFLPSGRVYPAGDGFLAVTRGGPDVRLRSLSKVSHDWVEEWSVPEPSPGSIFEYPYWGSFSRFSIAARGDRAWMVYGFLYSIVVVDVAGGSVVDTVHIEAPGFDRASVPKAGAFTGEVGRESLDRWLASFDMLPRIDVVADSFLVVTRGRIKSDSSLRFIYDHTAIDVFRLEDLSPLWWDVQLPEGARVLSGGRSLHVLTGSAPDPLELTSFDFIGRHE
ncbi:MAG: hypothetical protein RQ745_03065 [Longimicrobiales bacterium]|nr:hypothetical protein [Longimicrobiales bacterium]